MMSGLTLSKLILQNTDNIIGYELDKELVDSLNECKEVSKINVIKI